jgi:hypothetical protein
MAAMADGNPRRGPLAGSRTVAVTAAPVPPLTSGATTGWLAAGGACVLPGGKDGKIGTPATAGGAAVWPCDAGLVECTGVADGELEGVALELVGVGLAVTLGATECTGAAEWVGDAG